MDKESSDTTKTCLTAKRERLGQNLSKQTLDGSFCDVTLIVDGDEFPAHKCVLASCSDYFHKMFTVEMKEKYDKKIEIKGIKADAFRLMLDWIYTEKILMTNECFFDLYRGSSMMQISELSDVLQTWLEEHFEDEVLKKNLLEFTYDEVFQLVVSDKLNVFREKSVYDFIVSWTIHDIGMRRTYFPNLFKFVRLQLISTKIVWSEIRQNALVNLFFECRRLVDERLSSVFSSSACVETEIQTQRLGAKPDLLLQLSLNESFVIVYNINTKQKITYRKSIFNLDKTLPIKTDCAIATNYPVSYMCGGPSTNPSRKVIKFDGRNLIEQPDMCKARFGAAATFFNNHLYVFGGQSDSSFHYVNFLKSYEIFTDCWNEFELIGPGRSYLGAHTVKDKIYLIGGFIEKFDIDSLKYSDLSSDKCRLACKTSNIFCPHMQSLTEISPMTTARAAFTSAVHKSNIYVCGGVDQDGKSLSSMEFLETTNDVWTAICVRNLFATPIVSSCVVQDKLYINVYNKIFCFSFSSQRWKNFYNVNEYRKFSFVLLPFDQISLENCLKNAPKPNPTNLRLERNFNRDNLIDWNR